MDGSWWTCPTQTYSQSQLREWVQRAHVCVLTPPPTCTPQHVRRRSSPPPRAVAACRFCPRHPVTPTVPSLEPDGWSSDPTAAGWRITGPSCFFSHKLVVWPVSVTKVRSIHVSMSCFPNKPEKLNLPAHPKGNVKIKGRAVTNYHDFSFLLLLPEQFLTFYTWNLVLFTFIFKNIKI